MRTRAISIPTGRPSSAILEVLLAPRDAPSSIFEVVLAAAVTMALTTLSANLNPIKPEAPQKSYCAAGSRLVTNWVERRNMVNPATLAMLARIPIHLG